MTADCSGVDMQDKRIRAECIDYINRMFLRSDARLT